jgi:hypothetical protein
MLQQSILSGRIKKWAYALIEYDLAYEPLKSIKGQVVVDFIVGHSIDQNSDESCNLWQFIRGSCSLMVRHVEKVGVYELS